MKDVGINRELDLHITRRQLFGLTAKGIGVGALASLMGIEAMAALSFSMASRVHCVGTRKTPLAAISRKTASSA